MDTFDCEGITGSTPAGLLGLFRPITILATSELAEHVRASAQKFPGAFDEHELVKSLAADLHERLLTVSIKTLILEINVARIGSDLDGSTPGERFADFAGKLRTTAFREELLGRYPLLLREGTRICNQWKAANLEFVRRYCADQSLIKSVLNTSFPIPLVEAPSAADHHLNGRQVKLLLLENGQRLVYKPRPQAAAARLQEFVGWLNECGMDPPIRTIRVIDRGEYGWLEYVDHAGCQSEAEIGLFYERMGALLAIMYCLAGTDCHFQNVIASGLDPVLIDTEAIFQPQHQWFNEHRRVTILEELLADSVLSTGLLPEPSVVNGEVADISGLGARSFCISPLESAAVDRIGTDEPRLSREPFRIEEVHNRPVLNGLEVGVAEYAGSLDKGFTNAYRLLQNNSRLLVEGNGPLDKFIGAPTRIIFRPTATYVNLLEDSFHPHALIDGANRELVLAQLWHEVPLRPELQNVVFSEYQQLMEGDVPIFFSTPESREVVTPGGKTESLFRKCGLDVSKRRIGRFSEADLLRQRWLIKASIVSLGEGALQGVVPDIPIAADTSPIEISRSIADWLDKVKVRTERGTTWLTLKRAMSDGPITDRYKTGLIGPELYDGLAGICFYLLYVADLTGEERYRVLADECLKELEGQLADLDSIRSIGAFDGLSGHLYLFSHVATLGDNREFHIAENILCAIARILDNADPPLDIVSGLAGCIFSLLSWHTQTSNRRALWLAVRCGDLISNRLLSIDQGEKSGSPALPYSRGFSHGYAGVASALSRLWEVCGAYRFECAANAAISLERRLLESGRWTDPEDPLLSSQSTWCHGAPGIALGRILMSKVHSDATMLNEVTASLDATVLSFGLENHSLCHGMMGNLEPLLLAAETFADEPRWSRAYSESRAAVLDDIATKGLRPASPSNIEVPGLMTGLVGIGYQLLRMHAPERVPSVLALQPPRNIADRSGGRNRPPRST